MCNVQTLIGNCLLLFGQDGEVAPEALTSQSVFSLPLASWPLTFCIRQRKELNVFQKLLEMVPHLQERLTESSELEEYMTIADSVRLQFENSQIYAYRLPLDSKGRLKRKIGWHQESQGGRAGLDNSQRQAFESTAFPQRQDKPWLQPPRHWGAPLSGWPRLEWSRVTHFPSLHVGRANPLS